MKKILLIAPLALVAMAGTAHIYNSAENQSFNHNIRSISKANEVSEEGVFLVYFHAPEDWSNPNIWPWNNDSSENPFTPIGWPGRAMNADPNNDGWYYMYVPEYVDMLIFNYTDESGTTIQTNGDPIDKTLAGKNIWIDGITSEKQTDEEGVEKTVYHMATPTTEKLTSGELPEYVEERFAFARIPNDWDKAVATFTSSTDSTANYQLELALQSDKVWFGGIVDAKYDTVSINNGETDNLKESVEVKIEGSPFYVDVLDEAKINIDEIDFNDEEALFNFLSSLVSTRYLDSYRELNEEELLSFYNDESKGTEIKISGIIRPKKDTLVSSLNPGVYYSSILDEEYKNNNNPDFVDLNNDGKTSQDEDKRSKIAKSYESNIFVRFEGEFKLCVREIIGDPIESDDYINYILNRTKFGLDENVTSITIFPSNFEEKSAILRYIDEYNALQSDKNKIIYTDLTAIVFNNLETITNLISLVLIIFSALCLVVAVLLESLITYSSISERKHDIGILKSLGASKKDIFKIFSFESLIVGLISGLISLLLILISGLSLNGFFNSLFDVSGSIVNLSFLLVIIVILLGLFLQFISSFIPTLIYSQKTPIEIMKR